jgi:3-oxoacyl-[acyl-carrier-protein] synthase-1
MKRVVITGVGIVSSIGIGREAVRESLRQGRSGIVLSPEYLELGFRSHVHGALDIDLDKAIDRKHKRFMGDSASYNYIALKEAVDDAELDDEIVRSPRTGLVVGTGGGSPANIVEAADLLRAKGIRRVGPYMVTRTMSSTNAACLSTAFGIRGIAYTISSACATSGHCVGNAAELIQLGKQDVVFAGGGEELHWAMTMLFDAMGALSSKYNDSPMIASRTYDVDRDGFVISGGGGILVVEELAHAKARGAKIYAELVGSGATSDGYDMVQPSGEGAVRCMQQAIADVDGTVDYLNTHGTSTPIGDIRELEAIREVFGNSVPRLSATKSMTGHALGAAGVNEAIYTLLMMESDFIAPSINIEQLDPGAEEFPIVRETVEDAGLNLVMSNSFGFGGTNSTLLFQRWKD